MVVVSPGPTKKEYVRHGFPKPYATKNPFEHFAWMLGLQLFANKWLFHEATKSWSLLAGEQKATVNRPRRWWDS